MTSDHDAQHFVAPREEIPLLPADPLNVEATHRSLWADAWWKLRRRPLFIISSLMILMIIVVVLFPGLFTQTPPNENCHLANSAGPPVPGHPLGFTFQGCDVYSRIIHGTQASVAVGLLSVSGVLVIGVTFGAVSGYYGGWIDAVLARLSDIFFALPLVLGALVVAQLPPVRENKSVWTVALVISLLGWPQMARITRGAVLEVSNAEFVTAAKSLGVSKFGTLARHVLPNCMAPVVVLAPLELGTFIVTEATLSFLGIGLPQSVMSWGQDIAAAQHLVRTDPMILIYPAVALSITVLSFIMLGDALRDAFHPNSRRRSRKR
ncbi:ABC transporter permease [Arthrobacter sp. ISL-28]|uniref:ABC transporter permease n=1 Tax=Arthrobacter sp. ISL-28 TaxID=2819108 RepID=UPI001BEC7E4E|nr:ABC transporter permease [Arthrobacter sp. ISL-28]MBT2520040.1 ABC transporter permease [Arthrobacter sp. ISL-28]